MPDAHQPLSTADDRTAQLLSDFFDNAAVGLHLQGQDGCVLRVNRAELDLLGYSEDEYVGQPIARFHADPAVAADIVRRLAAGETLHSYEARLRARDGSVKHVLISANVLWEDGRFVHARCFTRDITAQKLAQDALVEADRRKAAILNASLDAIITMDAGGMLVDFNAAAERIFGYPREHAIGRRLADLLIPPALRRQHEEGLRRYLATGEGPVLGKRIEISALHAHGHEFPVELSIAVVRDVHPILFTATLRDITPRLKAEQELRAALAERRELLESERAARAAAERLSAVKDQFLATLSHELRTPLSAILGWAQILRRRPDSVEEVRKGVEVIERNARVQTRLIEELLDVSRIASGKVQLDVQPVDPWEVVHAALDAVRPAAAAKGIELEVAPFVAVGMIPADPHRLQQVVWNLLSNAVKFSDTGGRVVVSVREDGGAIEIAVTDTGAGIDPEFLPHVFERFRQADASTTRHHGGLGLGLAIVRSLVELHGGTVRAHSDGPGQGSRFVVRLPLERIARAPGAEEGPLAQPPGEFHAVDLADLQVLVVDDEPDARELLQRILCECGARVLQAAGAAQALELLQANRPDVLVSDIGMPGIDGYELIRRVRGLAAEQGGATPAIALTAFARPEDGQKARQAGFQAHLSKPLEPWELVMELRRLAAPA